MRPRKKANKALPQNLYFDPSTGFYRYRRPDDGRKVSMGKQRAEAIGAAKRLNDVLIPKTDLVKRVLEHTGEHVTFAEHLDYMEKLWRKKVTDDQLSPHTEETYLKQAKRMRAALGEVVMSDATMTVKVVSEFLESIKGDTSRKRFRGTLMAIFNRAGSRGLMKHNPATFIIQETITVQRQRLTLEAFKTIRKHGSKVLQDAMDVGLITLQREADVAALTFDQINLECDDPTIQLQQQKSKKVHLEIEMGDALRKVITRCRQDGVLSKYVVHYPYTSGHGRKLVGKGVSARNIISHFAKARKKAMDAEGLFAGMTKEQLPTFHEIRALGAKCYAEAGIWPRDLLGHTSDTMTQKYLERHEIKWTRVKATLALPV